MTATLPTIALPAAPLRRLGQVLAHWRRGEPAFFGMGVLLLVAALPMGVAALADDRMFGGADIWTKPIKFALAIAVYLMTLALFAHALPAGLTGRPWYRLYRGAVIAAAGAEMLWIAGAAGAGTASHFNDEGLWAVVYPVMGLVATLLTTAAAVYAVAIARNSDAGLPPALRDGLVLGLALVLPLTLVTAGTMSAGDGHLVGTAGPDAAAVPFFGWSREVGDLRVPHFLATHAMHVVPMAGLAAAWLWGGTRRRPIWGFAAAYVALVAFAFMQALAGRPLLPMT